MGVVRRMGIFLLALLVLFVALHPVAYLGARVVKWTDVIILGQSLEKSSYDVSMNPLVTLAGAQTLDTLYVVWYLSIGALVLGVVVGLISGIVLIIDYALIDLRLWIAKRKQKEQEA